MILEDSAALDERAVEAPLLDVRGLRVAFRIPGGVLDAVDGVSFALRRGETLGLVGESGSGKTMTALALMRLLETPPARVGGQAVFEGRDLLALPERAMEDLRGARLSMIFQEPMTSLNPVMTIGRQVAEPLVRHAGLSAAAARARSLALLRSVGIPDPAGAAASYPHRLSGGMRQRVMIAIAIACGPAVLIADEPTTALDVTIQAQILALLETVQRETGTAILLITHDLAVVAETAHRVAVMYSGRIVESGPTGDLFAAPMHPYSEGLLRSIPRIVRHPLPELPEIAGTVPSALELPAGCSFAPRCGRAEARCHAERPVLEARRSGTVACFRPLH